MLFDWISIYFEFRFWLGKVFATQSIRYPIKTCNSLHRILSNRQKIDCASHTILNSRIPARLDSFLFVNFESIFKFKTFALWLEPPSSMYNDKNMANFSRLPRKFRSQVSS
jgi:hypothetical protein